MVCQAATDLKYIEDITWPRGVLNEEKEKRKLVYSKQPCNVLFIVKTPMK